MKLGMSLLPPGSIGVWQEQESDQMLALKAKLAMGIFPIAEENPNTCRLEKNHNYTPLGRGSYRAKKHDGIP